MMARSVSMLFWCAFLLAAAPAQATLTSDRSGKLWDHDVAKNTSTLVGSGSAWWDIALDPTTDFLYGITSTGVLMSIDTSKGAETVIGGGANEAQITGLTFDSSGTLFASGDDILFTVDLTTGLTTQVGSNGGSERSRKELRRDSGHRSEARLDGTSPGVRRTRGP